MATVSVPMPSVPTSAVKTVSLKGCFTYWTAHRVLRQEVITSLNAVGETAVPPIDRYDAAVETGKIIVAAGTLKQRSCPIKWESLSRDGVGVEFTQTIKGDQQNQRVFLFSLGVNKSDQLVPVKVGTNPAIVKFFNDPNCQTVLDQMYKDNLQYMPSSDVTEAVSGLINRNRGVRLKPTGGVYFVPDCAMDKLDKVFTALNRAGCRCTMLKHDLSNDMELSKQVLECTNEQLEEALTELQEEMQDILDNNKKPRINGIRTKMQQLAQYADLLDYYKKMFGTGLEQAEKNMHATFDLLAELQLRYKGGND